MNSDWFFGITTSDNQQEIHRLFSQAKSGSYCVHWNMIEKKFILSYIPSNKKVTDITDIVQMVLPMQNISELQQWMKTESADLMLVLKLTCWLY